MHTTATNGPNWVHDPPIRPTTCTPDEFQTLVGIVQEMNYGQTADLLRACLTVHCRRAGELRNATSAHEKNLLALALHAAGGINETINRIDFLHDPEPVRRFLKGFMVDLFAIAGGKGVARAG